MENNNNYSNDRGMNGMNGLNSNRTNRNSSRGMSSYQTNNFIDLSSTGRSTRSGRIVKTIDIRAIKENHITGENIIYLESPSDTYKIIKRDIDGGSFGSVHIAESQNNNEHYVVKGEKRRRGKVLHLRQEFKIMQLFWNCKNIPRVYLYVEFTEISYMVMDLEGPNLGTLFKECQKFSDATLLHIIIEVLNALKAIHKKGVIHRDLKPENIVVGKWPSNPRLIYLIDFGLSKKLSVKYYDGNRPVYKKFQPRAPNYTSEERKLVQDILKSSKFKKKLKSTHYANEAPHASLTGTSRYVSVNAHYGSHSFRDDLISLGHVFIYILNRGYLPWMGIKSAAKGQKFIKMWQQKILADNESLYVDIVKPKPIVGLIKEYMQIVTNLKYLEKPNYSALKRDFRKFLDDYTGNVYKLSWEKDNLLSYVWPKID